MRLARKPPHMDLAVTNSRFAATRQHSAPATLQARLEIGPVNDPLEREADRVADKVMHMPDPHSSLASGAKLQRTCSACEEKETTNRLARKEAGVAAGSQYQAAYRPSSRRF